MVEAKKKKTEEDNSHMFNRLTSHNPPVYNGALDLNGSEDWIWGMEKLFDALQCPEELRVRFVIFYLKDNANL